MYELVSVRYKFFNKRLEKVIFTSVNSEQIQKTTLKIFLESCFTAGAKLFFGAGSLL